jgi:hypothetical protein
MDISDFKKLETKRQPLFKGAQLKRTLIAMVIGAIIGFAWFYYSEGQHMGIIPTADILKSISIGALFGIFITNSPCARGKC